MFKSEYEHVKYKQIASITLYSTHTYIHCIVIIGSCHGSEYQLTSYTHSSMSLFLDAGVPNSVVTDTIKKSVPRLRHRYLYIYLFLVTGTFRSNTGLGKMMGKIKVLNILMFYRVFKRWIYAQLVYFLRSVCCIVNSNYCGTSTDPGYFR